MKAFVTGATGQLGSNLVSLLLEQGWEVKALVRSKEKAHKLLGHTRAEIVVGDLEDIQGFAPALKGVDVVFHTAAYFREYYDIGDHWQTLKKLNVDATIELLNHAEKNGVKKVVHTSSSGVIGHATNGQPSDETTPPDYMASANLYFKSKLLCEQAILDWLKTHTLPVTMILPTLMIGTQDAAPTAFGEAIISIAKGTLPAVPPGGFSFVDSRDVAQAMINAVEKGKSGERYIVSEGYHTIQELTVTASQVAGVSAPRLRLNYPVAMVMATVSEFGAQLTKTKPLMTKAAVQSMAHGVQINAHKAKQELGVTFRTFTQSIQDEVNWYKQNGYLN